MWSASKYQPSVSLSLQLRTVTLIHFYTTKDLNGLEVFNSFEIHKINVKQDRDSGYVSALKARLTERKTFIQQLSNQTERLIFVICININWSIVFFALSRCCSAYRHSISNAYELMSKIYIYIECFTLNRYSYDYNNTALESIYWLSIILIMLNRTYYLTSAKSIRLYEKNKWNRFWGFRFQTQITGKKSQKYYTE